MSRLGRPLALTLFLAAACAGEEFSAPEASSSSNFTGSAGSSAHGGAVTGGARSTGKGGSASNPSAGTPGESSAGVGEGGGEASRTSGGTSNPGSGGTSNPSSGGTSDTAGAGDAGSPSTGNCPLGFTGPTCAAHVHACRDLPSTAPSGTYVIDPDGAGPLPAFDASCAMDNGGGWTLILNYVHKGATNPTLTARKDSLPVLGSSELGVDESALPKNWGHAAPTLLAALAPQALRFYGRISLREAVVDFTTTDAGCIGYAAGGTTNCKGLLTNATLLADHTASLPAVATAFMAGKGELALTEFPFYLGGQAHWAIRGEGLRWEVDNTPVAGVAKNLYDTIHRVWMR